MANPSQAEQSSADVQFGDWFYQQIEKALSMRSTIAREVRAAGGTVTDSD
jgi:hypothetical protein